MAPIIPRPADADVPRDRSTPPARRRPLAPRSADFSFLARYGVAPAVLAEAAAQATTLGVTADEVLRADGRVGEERFYRYLAHHLAVGFTLQPLAFDETFALPALRAGIAPLASADGPRFVMAPTGDALSSLLRERTDAAQRRASLLLTTPSHLAAATRSAAEHALAGLASYGLARFDPDLSAAPGSTGVGARGVCVALLLGFVGTALLAGTFPAAALLAVSTLLLAAVALRLCVCAASCGLATVGDLPLLVDAALPRYTVLVPLYREARVVPALVAAMDALDYPRAKLQIVFILEADDAETLAALRALPLGPAYEIVVAPPGAPRTKPRALNVALPLARGEIIAIFDAEDEPGPGQLRLAASHLAVAPRDVACLQARLALYNASDSWLSVGFALDYAALFEVMNPGLAAMRLPVPLGGTSTHFRADILRAIGAWDAWNVTEDADLGLRLARFGYRTEILASTTTEEAPARLIGWFRQRRRWFKGWQQTQMTLARAPRRLVREMGAWPAALTALLLIAQVQAPLLWPISTLLLVWRVLSVGLPTPVAPLDLIAVTAWVSLVVAGCGLTAFSTWLGMRRRRLMRLWPWLPLLPVYRLLVSFAAWAAVVDLIRRPHWWDKTEHGLTTRPRPAQRAAM